MISNINIIAFDVPYPPNYGGVIDVFYKLKELHQLNIQIYLHVYLLDNKKEQIELEKYCEKVYYYERKNTITSLLSYLPFRVKSRSNKQLTNNLTKIDAPIIFEGLHSIYSLSKFNLKKSFVRTHNIEHSYFFGLSKSERNLFKKCFFLMEAIKLKHFEKQLHKADGIFTISPFEQDYFSEKYGEKSHYIPAFHETLPIKNSLEKGKFILFHGDLRVSDNIKAALFLIDIYKNTKYKLIIASSTFEPKISSEVKKSKNISIEDIPTQTELNELLKRAHINTLFSFQKTGIKLKLLNTLYKGKFIIANNHLIEDTGLENLCVLANTKEEVLRKTEILFNKEFSEMEIQKRLKKLQEFSPKESAKKIVNIIFN